MRVCIWHRPKYNYYLDQWETMRSRSEIVEGPENVPITYSNDALLGLTVDCRGLRKVTCGIAVIGEQRSLVADLIIDIGITKATRIKGAIQRKQELLKIWAEAYSQYKRKCNHQQCEEISGSETRKCVGLMAW